MKIKHILPILTLAAATVSCTDLQRFPLDQGSSETWYSTETEFEMAVADMYRPVWWNLGQEAWNDDYFYRKIAGQPIIDGQLNSKTDHQRLSQTIGTLYIFLSRYRTCQLYNQRL